jgi:hypothetical protein
VTGLGKKYYMAYPAWKKGKAATRARVRAQDLQKVPRLKCQNPTSPEQGGYKSPHLLAARLIAM